MKTTHGATDTLKGLAILAVLINHYLNLNIQGYNAGFGNLIIAVFYMLSGYGIYYSLERLSDNGKLTIGAVVNFYYSRFARVFPLFWLAYITESVLFGQQISVLALLGVHCPNHYWFIASIIQCYILAPVIFVIVRQYRWLTLNIIVFLFVIFNLVMNSLGEYQLLDKYLSFMHLNWRGLYFLYVSIFSLSMLLPKCIDSWELISISEKRYYFFFVLIMALLFMVLYDSRYNFRHVHVIKQVYDMFVATLIPLTLFLIGSVYLISYKIEIGWLAWLGKISFSVYLFHMIIFMGISDGFSFKADSIPELLTTLICFPLFLYLCKHIDQVGIIMAAAINSKFQPVCKFLKIKEKYYK